MRKIYLSTFAGNTNASKEEWPDRLQRDNNKKLFIFKHLSHAQRNFGYFNNKFQNPEVIMGLVYGFRRSPNKVWACLR